MSNALLPEKLTNIECCSLGTTISRLYRDATEKGIKLKAKQWQRNTDRFFLKQLPKLAMSLHLQAAFSAV